MKMNKKLKTFLIIIRNMLPMSRYSIYKYDKLIMDLLHAQTEMMMLNRSDILALSTKRAMPRKCDKSCKSKMDEFRDMYE